MCGGCVRVDCPETCPFMPGRHDQQRINMDKITQAKQLLDEVNADMPEGVNFRFAVVELPRPRR